MRPYKATPEQLEKRLQQIMNDTNDKSPQQRKLVQLCKEITSDCYECGDEAINSCGGPALCQYCRGTNYSPEPNDT